MRMGKVTILSASFFFPYGRPIPANCLKSINADTITAASAATTPTSEIIDAEKHDIESPSTSPFENEYTIRAALYSELPMIASLVTAGFHPELDSNPIMRPIRVLLELDRLQNNFPYQGDDRHLYLVCEATKEDKKVVGFCDVDARVPVKKKENQFSPFSSTVNRPHPYFSDLTVDPNYRRKGIASALVEEGERRAKYMNCREMYLGVVGTNTAALNLYSNMGYETIVPTGDILEFLKQQKGVRMLRRTLN